MILLYALALSTQFAPPDEVTLSIADPQGLQVSDIDADGYLDILVGSRETGEIFAWHGSAAGYLARPEVVAQPGANLERFEVIDLDLDGDEDFVIALPEARLVAYLNDGAGHFGAAVPLLSAPAGATEAKVHFDFADVAGDPRPEIVFSFSEVITISDRSVFALSDLLGGAPTRSLLVDAANTVIGVFARDFDVDGDADLFLCTLDTVFWYRNDGAFSFIGSDAVLWPGIGLDANFAVGDFDGDGHLDVVSHAIGTFSTRTHAHLGDGTVQFGAPIDLGYNERQGRQIELRDLDSDGDDDLVIGEGLGGGLLTIESLSGGAFGPLIDAPSGAGGVPSMDVVDTDGDGELEVVHVTSKGYVRIQFVDPLAASLELSSEVVAITQTVQEVSASMAADLNGDGFPDVLVLEQGLGQLRWWPGTSTGAVGNWEDPVVIGPYPCGLEALDVDDDGDMDLIVSIELGGGLSLLENLGGGVFATPIPIPVAGPAQCGLRAVDVNGDGLADIVRWGFSQAEFYWIEQLGGGAFAPERLLLAPAQLWQSFTFADMEGDGDIDVLLDSTQLQVSLTVLEWYVNDGAANFTGPILALSTTIGLAAGFSQGIALGDYNGDGLSDVAQSFGRKASSSTFPGAAVLSVMLGIGAGAFAPPQAVDSRDSWSIWSPSTADVDGDGVLDLLVNSSRLDWYRGRGDGTFAQPVTLQDPLAFFTGSWHHSVDLDLDGDLDHVVSGANGGGIVTVETLALGELGTVFCDPSVPHSGGLPAALSATGSAQVLSNGVSLVAHALPPQAMTVFLLSATKGEPMPVINSQGSLCLTGPIGRFVGPGQVQVANATGQASLSVDLGQLPQPTGFTGALAGDEWAFQAWYRDTVSGAPTSNFTHGAAVRFL